MTSSSFGNFPLTGQAGDDFYRRRLALFATLVGVNLLVFRVTGMLLRHETLHLDGALATVAVAPALVAVGELLRRRAWPRRALNWVDPAIAIGICWMLLRNLFVLPLLLRPELITMLAATNILFLRAALVPGSAGRAAWISSAAVAPLVPLAYLQNASRTPQALALAINLSEWCLSAVISSTLCSWYIYRLARSAEASRKLGPYTLEQKIGQGGMGEVYRARHALLRRPTAVKLLLSTRGDEQDIARFEREVQLTSQLTNPNTIQIYDFGRSDDGTFYYAMELIDGLTLDELVRSYGRQAPWRVAQILADICEALAEAHAASLVHRDIKPQNVMLCARGGLLDQVKVLDFGLVRSVRQGSASASMIRPQIVGTPSFMAPEAYVTPASVDARTDLYAVGAVGYYLLTGALPFQAANGFEVFAKLVHEEPTPISELVADTPPALQRLVHACLSKAQRNRPQDARALCGALRAVAESLPAMNLEAWWQQHLLHTPPREPASPYAETRVLNTSRLAHPPA